ncbi:MAG: flagellar export protein FliJ [Syntrophomonadales bacterium]|jgi:flagellar FliJ protein
MNTFKFRLQTPYDVASWREKIAKQEVKERQIAYDHEEQTLNEKLAGMRHLIDQERELQGRHVSFKNIISLKELQGMSQVGVRVQQKAVDQALSRLEESRRELTELAREKKSMEKLKERRYQEFLNEYRWQEQVSLDEVAVTSFWRNRSGQEKND